VAIFFKVFTTLLPDSLNVFGGSASSESSSFGFVPGSLSDALPAGFVPVVAGLVLSIPLVVVLGFPAFGSPVPLRVFNGSGV